MSTLQALALAKAQALSLALKSSTALQGAGVSASAGSGADGKTEAEKLKSLVDKIPTERYVPWCCMLRSIVSDCGHRCVVYTAWLAICISYFLLF